MPALPSLRRVGRDRGFRGGSGGSWCLAALRRMAAGGARPGAGPARSDHARCRTASSSTPTAYWGGEPRDAGADHAGRRRRPSTRSCARSATPAPRPSSAPAPLRLLEILGPGTAVYHVSILSFVFRLPGHAEPDRPAMIDRIVEGFRAPILCDDVPIDTRVGIGLKALARRRRQPGRGPARHAVGGAGQPRRRSRGWAWYDRKSDEAHRRAFRLLDRPQGGARRRGPARAALPAEGGARHRRLHQRRGAAALDPPAARAGLAGRVRRRWPRPPRWSRR